MKRQRTPVPVVIPVYNPPALFEEYIRSLRRAIETPIIVVNDGSSPPFDPLFAAIARLPGTTVLRHTVNRGKGAALKTAMTHTLALASLPSGIVTVDADGQHAISDVEKTLAMVDRSADSLLIGSRFDRIRMPAKSRFGNALTRSALRVFHGRMVFDTQSGLRYIPLPLMHLCISSVFDRYDFELDMIVHAVRARIPIAEFPIETIYINRNRASHFKSVNDSMHVAKVFWHHLVTPKKVQLSP